MVIIYGHRSYGRVEQHGGEYAHTQFAHIYYMPLFPTGSSWVIGGGRGIKIGLHGKSVLAAYLRTWGMALALLALFASPGPIGIAVMAALAALSIYAWTWTNLKGERARRRGDFNLMAYGTRCEPARMLPETRAAIRTALEGRRARFADPRPPEDVARFGARHRDEAVIAYGLLRLAEVDHGSREATADAERLLDGNHDQLPVVDGPYREPGQEVPDAMLPEMAVPAAAASAVPKPPSRPRPPYRGFLREPVIRWVLIAACFSLGALGLSHVGAALGPRPVSSTSLDEHSTGFVALTCTSSAELGTWQPEYEHEKYRVFDCNVGDRSLLVVTELRVTELPHQVKGDLHPLGDIESYLPPEVTSRPSFLHLKLVAYGNDFHLLFSILGAHALLGGIGMVIWWLVDRRRTRATV